MSSSPTESTAHPAYANNERIFSRFETNFRNGWADNGEDSFGETARKFATWLGVDRAYYEQGRPSIVRLLETAKDTVQRLAGVEKGRPFHVSQCPPELSYWVNAYVHLLRTVQPFEHHFVDDRQRESLDRLYATIFPPPTRPVPPPLRMSNFSQAQQPRDSLSSIPPVPGYASRSAAGTPTSPFVPFPPNASIPMPPRSAPAMATQFSADVAPRAPSQPNTPTIPQAQGEDSASVGPRQVHTIPSSSLSQVNYHPQANPQMHHQRQSQPQAMAPWLSGSQPIWHVSSEGNPTLRVAPTEPPHSSVPTSSGTYTTPRIPTPTTTTAPFMSPLFPSTASLVSPSASAPPSTTSPNRQRTFDIPTSPPAASSSSTFHNSPTPAAPASASAPVPAKKKKSKPFKAPGLDFDFLASDLKWFLEQKEAEKKKKQEEEQSNAPNQDVAMPEEATTQDVAMKDESVKVPDVGVGSDRHDPDPAESRAAEHEQQPGKVEGDMSIDEAQSASVPVEEALLAPEEKSHEDLPAASAGIVADATSLSQTPDIGRAGEEPAVANSDVCNADLSHADKMDIDTVPTSDQVDSAPSTSDNAIATSTQPEPAISQGPETSAPSDQSQGVVSAQAPAEDSAPAFADVPQSVSTVQSQLLARSSVHVPAPIIARVLDLSKIQSPLKSRLSKKATTELIVQRPPNSQNPFAVRPAKSTSPAAGPSSSTSAPPPPASTTSSLAPAAAQSTPAATTPTGVDTATVPDTPKEASADSEDEHADEEGDDEMKGKRGNNWTHKKKRKAPTAVLVEGGAESPSVPKAKKGPPGIRASQLSLRTDAGPSTTPSNSEAEHEHARPTVKGNKKRKGPPGIRSAPVGAAAPATPTKASAPGPSSSPTKADPQKSPLTIRIPPMTPRKATKQDVTMSSDSEDEEPLAIAVRRSSMQKPSPRRPSATTSAPAAESLDVGPSVTGDATEPPSTTATPSSAMEVDEPANTATEEPAASRPTTKNAAVLNHLRQQLPTLQEILSQIKLSFAPKDEGTLRPVSENVDWNKIDSLYPGISSTANPDNDEYTGIPLFDNRMQVLSFQRGAKNLQPCELRFSITEQQKAACELWAARHTSPEGVVAPRCVSIFCFQFDECANALTPLGDDASPNDVFNRKPIPWPKAYRQKVVINGRVDNSHNFVVTNYHTPRDELIDIANQVLVGENVVTVTPLGGSAEDVVFAVLLHFPTPRQMAEFEWKRDGDREWHGFVKGITTFSAPSILGAPITRRTNKMDVNF